MLNKLITNTFATLGRVMNVNFKFNNELLKGNNSPTLLVKSI